MKPSQPIPVRHVAAFGITTLCGWLAALVHIQAVSYPTSEPLLIAPPPPAASFPQAFLVMPGVLAGSPLALLGAIFEREWLMQTGLVLGSGFFWYCVGWRVDSARGILTAEKAPVIVRWYLSALIMVSIILLPFGIIAGLRLGIHSCAVGVPPYWVELVGYGMVMFWVTLGCFFGWQRYRSGRNRNDSVLSLWMG